MDQQKNWAIAKRELLRQKVGDLLQANTSPQIRDCAVEDIRQVLALVSLKIGLRAENYPAEEEKVVLIDHVLTYYGHYHVDEIRLAFDMAIIGELDVDATCYECFSCAYFSSIMRAYKKWGEKKIKSVGIEYELQQKIFTQDELDNAAREDVERQYQAFLRRSELYGLVYNYSILAKDKLIRDGETVLEFFERRVAEGYSNIYKQDDIVK